MKMFLRVNIQVPNNENFMLKKPSYILIVLFYNTIDSTSIISRYIQLVMVGISIIIFMNNFIIANAECIYTT